MGSNLSIVVPQQDATKDNAKGVGDGTFVPIGPPAKCGEIDAFILAKVTSQETFSGFMLVVLVVFLISGAIVAFELLQFILVYFTVMYTAPCK